MTSGYSAENAEDDEMDDSNDKDGKKQEIIIGPEEPKDMVKDRRVSVLALKCEKSSSNH